MSDHACKNCKLIIMQGNVCPVCGSTQLTTKWSGSIVVIDAEKSEIAKKLEIKVDGTYAININD